jgi:hypothetical protein
MPRFSRWLESEALVEQRAQSLISVGNGFAKPEGIFRFHCEAPERLVEHVDCKAALGCIEGSPCLAGVEAGATDFLEQLNVCASKAANVPIAPGEVAAGKWLVSEEPESVSELVATRARISPAGFVQPRFEFVHVYADPAAVEPVTVALAHQGIADEPPRVAHCLIQAVAASLRILAGPEGLEDLVALGALPSEGEERDQLERTCA